MSDEKYALQFSQIGVPYSPDHSIFATYYLKEGATDTYKRLKKAAQTAQKACKKTDFRSVVICGVGFDQWRQWCNENSLTIPKGFCDTSILDVSPPYKNTGGNFLFHIKSDRSDECRKLFDMLKEELSDITDRIDHTIGERIHDGKVYGGRLLHGVIRSVDPINVSARAIVGDEDIDHKGSCYAITQKFVHNWSKLNNMTEDEIENMIGRDKKSNIILNNDKGSHIKTVRAINEDRYNIRLMGQAQPFGISKTGNGREKGVYVLAYAKSGQNIHATLDGMRGKGHTQFQDRHLLISPSVGGNFWYIPSADELKVKKDTETQHVTMNDFFAERSKNGYMFYNSKDYLHQIGTGKYDPKPGLSDRVVELLAINFSRWNETWYTFRTTPPLPHLEDYLRDKTDMSEKEIQKIMNSSVAIRKGLAIKYSLTGALIEPEYAEKADLFRLGPKEIIVGVMPALTLGTGTVVMRYLRQDEKIPAFLKSLNEFSAMGHNLPNHKTVLSNGIGNMIKDVKNKLAKCPKSPKTQEKKDIIDFYQSVIYSLEGVRDYSLKYAELALKTKNQLAEGQVEERKNLQAVHDRMKKLATEKPGSFVEAAQLVFTIHSTLHLIGEPVSVGRLDQYLAPFYEKDDISKEDAQEIIDCFWIKMSEKVLYNRSHFDDHLTYGTGAVCYSAGNFPQGSAINQWVMQVTVGGYKANNAKTPEDACNDITMMCLRSSRRLPLNAPCLSLRVHDNMPSNVIKEAAKSILSGGAHPILINDDALCEGFGKFNTPKDTKIPLTSLRNFACDGCYEPLFEGQTEFAFLYVPALDALEKALNQGTMYITAGPIHITGMKLSFQSKHCREIESFDELLNIFYQHYYYGICSFYNIMLNGYGSLWEVCPSPYLSVLLDGCIESGRDLSNGGAQYHLMSPMIQGLSNTINSLWAIKHMVFDSRQAITTLPELLECLFCDWGNEMIEPFQDVYAGKERADERAVRYKDMREHALGLQQFGFGHKEIDKFGAEIINNLQTIVMDTFYPPESDKEYTYPMLNMHEYQVKEFQELRKKLADTYGTPEKPFDILIVPGVGTFEEVVGLGLNYGASADGRRKGMPLESDFSATPSQQDLPVDHQYRDIFNALKSWTQYAITRGFTNAAPVDVNIREDFPEKDLIKVIEKFAKGKIGSNLITITCANPETFDEALQYPEKYDLVRVRMGGWSEFFVAMFPDIQQQHRRRPLFLPKKE